MSMRQSFTIDGIKKRHGRLVRAEAIFFLLFTVADITMPQYFCGRRSQEACCPAASSPRQKPASLSRTVRPSPRLKLHFQARA
jgi:hypothetical protein